MKTTGWRVRAEGVDYQWGLWAAHWGMFSPFGEPLLVPLWLQQWQNDWRWGLLGSRGDLVVGRVYLEAYVGNCPTQVRRSKKTPWWSVCVWFSGEALHEWNSGDGPIHHKSWLLSLRGLEDSTFENALGDFFFPFFLCICVRSCLEQALCLLVACETVSSRKLQKYFMKCSNKNIHVVQPMQNNTFG